MIERALRGDNDRKLECPACGSADVRRSARHGLLESLMKRVFVLPYRCIACRSRFFRLTLGFRSHVDDDAK